MDISEYRNRLCDANKKLLTEIEGKIPVKFEESNKDYWQAGIRKEENCGVIYYKEPFSDCKIAHELLHIKIGLIMGDNGIMLCYCGKNALLNWLFLNKDNDAASQILNAYEHLAIFPLYKNMGFDKDEFFEDQNENSYNEFIKKLDAEGIRNNGKISIDNFITIFSCLISFLFYPIDDRFKTHLAIIKNRERELYGIFKNFRDQLQKLPLNKTGRKQIQIVYTSFMITLDKFIMKNCDTDNDFFKMFSI